MLWIRARVLCCIMLSVATVIGAAGRVSANSRITEISQQIKERSGTIEELEEEIAGYQQEISQIGKEKKTLENAVYNYTLSIKKVATDVSLTQEKINTAQLSIEEAGLEIGEKELIMQQHTAALAEAMRAIHRADGRSLVEVLLAGTTLSTFWSEADNLGQFQVGVGESLDTLAEVKQELEIFKNTEETKKAELLGLRESLADKRALQEAQRSEKNSLLSQTKNKEGNYIDLLEDTVARKEKFERELFELEAALKLEIDPSLYIAARPGVLQWPVAGEPFVTQHFGDTPFARANSGVYKGNGHNGIDLRAPLGTPIIAALGGTVEAVGNTDAVAGCYSYGKWVLLRHNNGLSTLYAHLSLIKAREGAAVATGELIGYSGNTGYSTGPHLHFSVYASQGVRVQTFSRSINCKNATIPIADLKAYLSPLSYLPAL